MVQIQRARTLMTAGAAKNEKKDFMVTSIAGLHIIVLVSLLAIQEKQKHTVILHILALRPFGDVVIYLIFKKSVREGFSRVCCFEFGRRRQLTESFGLNIEEEPE